MVAKIFVALCASALLVQNISGQCIGNAFNTGVADIAVAGNGLADWAGHDAGWAGNGAGYGAGYGWAGNGYRVAAPVATGNGGAIVVTSSTHIAPKGILVRSENVIEGALTVTGVLPVLSAVAFEGQLPTAGSAGVSYGCGNGNIGIVSEGLAGAGLAGRRGCGFPRPLLLPLCSMESSA